MVEALPRDRQEISGCEAPRLAMAEWPVTVPGQGILAGHSGV